MTAFTGYNIWTGEVRDVKDPNPGSNKAKVIIHGHHNMDHPIDEDKLPWAHCVMNNQASLNNVGASHKYLPGSTVVGMWLDPETKQIPIILGSIARAGKSGS